MLAQRRFAHLVERPMGFKFWSSHLSYLSDRSLQLKHQSKMLRDLFVHVPARFAIFS